MLGTTSFSGHGSWVRNRALLGPARFGTQNVDEAGSNGRACQLLD